ncbi:polymorphic toxin-type HINT domain-containing protein, partial [Actinoallomurus sp. NPDC050550]|uniref:polymorphic toxin-type HINT domain-containing protein n=1 Tax=Actinoallomurus sp. NPDC050550 TaxID=3154937 RepID=UPI0033CB0012
MNSLLFGMTSVLLLAATLTSRRTRLRVAPRAGTDPEATTSVAAGTGRRPARRCRLLLARSLALAVVLGLVGGLIPRADVIPRADAAPAASADGTPAPGDTSGSPGPPVPQSGQNAPQNPGPRRVGKPSPADEARLDRLKADQNRLRRRIDRLGQLQAAVNLLRLYVQRWNDGVPSLNARLRKIEQLIRDRRFVQAAREYATLRHAVDTWLRAQQALTDKAGDGVPADLRAIIDEELRTGKETVGRATGDQLGRVAALGEFIQGGHLTEARKPSALQTARFLTAPAKDPLARDISWLTGQSPLAAFGPKASRPDLAKLADAVNRRLTRSQTALRETSAERWELLYDLYPSLAQVAKGNPAMWDGAVKDEVISSRPAGPVTISRQKSSATARGRLLDGSPDVRRLEAGRFGSLLQHMGVYKLSVKDGGYVQRKVTLRNGDVYEVKGRITTETATAALPFTADFNLLQYLLGKLPVFITNGSDTGSVSLSQDFITGTATKIESPRNSFLPQSIELQGEPNGAANLTVSKGTRGWRAGLQLALPVLIGRLGLTVQWKQSTDTISGSLEGSVSDPLGLGIKPLSRSISAESPSTGITQKIKKITRTPDPIALPPTENDPECKCFPAGTPISTTRGPKPVEDIRVGDMVWAHDLRTGRSAPQRVTALYRRPATEMLTFDVAGTKVQVTPDHPFWVPGRGWVQAGALRAGDPLLRRDGTTVRLRAVSRRRVHTTVYNFGVADDHDYYVGDAELLVHNCTPTSDEQPAGETQVAKSFGSNAEAARYGEKTWAGTWKTLTRQQRNAVQDYAAADYKKINDSLRGSGQPHRLVPLIDEALAKHPVPERLQVFRSVDEDAFTRPVTELAGTAEKAKGYTSAELAANPKFASYKKVLLHLEIEPGTPAMYLGDELGNPSERELLLARNLRIHYDRVELVKHSWGERWHVYATIGPDTDTPGASRRSGVSTPATTTSPVTTIRQLLSQAYGQGWDRTGYVQNLMRQIEQELASALPSDSTTVRQARNEKIAGLLQEIVQALENARDNGGQYATDASDPSIQGDAAEAPRQQALDRLTDLYVRMNTDPGSVSIDEISSLIGRLTPERITPGRPLLYPDLQKAGSLIRRIQQERAKGDQADQSLIDDLEQQLRTTLHTIVTSPQVGGGTAVRIQVPSTGARKTTGTGGPYEIARPTTIGTPALPPEIVPYGTQPQQTPVEFTLPNGQQMTLPATPQISYPGLSVPAYVTSPDGRITLPRTVVTTPTPRIIAPATTELPQWTGTEVALPGRPSSSLPASSIGEENYTRITPLSSASAANALDTVKSGGDVVIDHGGGNYTRFTSLPTVENEEAVVCNCFPAGTPVATTRGSVPIQHIRVGDEVWAHSLTTGRTEVRRVTALFHRHATRMLTLTISGGVTVQVTPDHPFWVQGHGWTNADDLRPGDRLARRNGGTARLLRVTERRVSTTVYNFTVAGDHDYYVSAAQLLVHNCTPPGGQHSVPPEEPIVVNGVVEQPLVPRSSDMVTPKQPIVNADPPVSYEYPQSSGLSEAEEGVLGLAGSSLLDAYSSYVVSSQDVRGNVLDLVHNYALMQQALKEHGPGSSTVRYFQDHINWLLSHSDSNEAETLLMYERLTKNPTALALAVKDCGSDDQCVRQRDQQWSSLYGNTMEQEVTNETLQYGTDPLSLARPVYGDGHKLLYVINTRTGEPDDYLKLVYQYRNSGNGKQASQLAQQIADRQTEMWQRAGVPQDVIDKANKGDTTALRQANQAATNVDAQQLQVTDSVNGYQSLVSGFTPDKRKSNTENFNDLKRYLGDQIDKNSKAVDSPYAADLNPSMLPFDGGSITYKNGTFSPKDPNDLTAGLTAIQMTENLSSMGDQAGLADHLDQSQQQAQNNLKAAAKKKAVASLKAAGYNVWIDEKGQVWYSGSGSASADVVGSKVDSEVTKDFHSANATYQTDRLNALIWARNNIRPYVGESPESYAKRLNEAADKVANEQQNGSSAQQAQTDVSNNMPPDPNRSNHELGLPGNTEGTDSTAYVQPTIDQQSEIQSQACQQDAGCAQSTQDYNKRVQQDRRQIVKNRLQDAYQRLGAGSTAAPATVQPITSPADLGHGTGGCVDGTHCVDANGNAYMKGGSTAQSPQPHDGGNKDTGSSNEHSGTQGELNALDTVSKQNGDDNKDSQDNAKQHDNHNGDTSNENNP